MARDALKTTETQVLLTAIADYTEVPWELALYAAANLPPTELLRAGLKARAASMPPRRRNWAARLSVIHASDPLEAASGLLQSDDGPTRAGATAELTELAERGDSDQLKSLLSEVTQDRDLTVRAAAGVKVASGAYWSCPDCAAHNAIDVLDCSSCPDGAIPLHVGLESSIGLARE